MSFERLRRSAFPAILIVLAGATPVLAQTQPPQAPAATAPARTGDCGQLPGGRAPVEKIADLTTGLSPRDLDLVYFGKPLADLTAEDFQRIGELSERCGADTGILPADKLQRFETVVRTAQQVRRTLLDGIKRQMTEITALPIARDKLVRLNELADGLPALEPALPRGDIRATAAWIARENQAIYDAAPKATFAPATMSAPPVAAKAEADTLMTTGAPPPPRRRPGGEEE